MILPLPSPLPRTDRMLLRASLRLTPPDDRENWLRCWQAELWHRHHLRDASTTGAADLYAGLIRDALWLRGESWRIALTGTAVLCLLVLSTLLLLTSLPLLVLTGTPHALMLFLIAAGPRFLCEASLVTIVSFATASQYIEHAARAATLTQLRTRLFEAAKLASVLAIAFLLSTDVFQPIEATHCFLAEILQPLAFVLLALCGLRWSFQDGDGRCKHCLRALASPARVGRPSWNFLDTNGTELLCTRGHGLLSIPQIETSWRRSSRWIAA
jgi:hypothetical protein